jgi:hypothetical protein
MSKSTKAAAPVKKVKPAPVIKTPAAKASKSAAPAKTTKLTKSAPPAALAKVKAKAAPPAAVIVLAPVLPPLPSAPDPEIAKLFAPPKPLEHTTEVFDEYELASMREMEATAELVRLARLKAQVKAPDDWDRESCYDCGREIEAKRFALGYYTCIHCEREKEVRSRQFRR